jgi:hypothetical protein
LDVTVDRLALDMIGVFGLPVSLLATIREAIEAKAKSSALSFEDASKAIECRAIIWMAAYQMAPRSPIDEKWFKTARYNAWPRPNRRRRHSWM